MGEVAPPLVKQCQRIARVFGLHWPGIALEGGHTGCCGGIDAVVLAACTAGQLPDPRGRAGRDVDDLFTSRKQPRGHVASHALGVFDRPPALRPLTGPVQHALVFLQRHINAERGAIMVGFGVYGCGSVGGLVRVDADQHH